MRTSTRSPFALLPLFLALTACATRPDERGRLIRMGDPVARAEVLEQRLARPGKKRVRGRAQTLYQLALLYADPGAPTHDPQRAKRVLDRLVAEYPSSRHRPVADVLRGLGRHVHALEQASRVIQRDITTLHRERDRCQARLAAPKPQPKAEPPPVSVDLQRLAADRTACDETIRRLRTAVANRDDQIARLVGALEALKRIDTETTEDPDG